MAEEVLGAIERDADALAQSVASLVDNLRINLDSSTRQGLTPVHHHLSST